LTAVRGVDRLLRYGLVGIEDRQRLSAGGPGRLERAKAPGRAPRRWTRHRSNRPGGRGTGRATEERRPPSPSATARGRRDLGIELHVLAAVVAPEMPGEEVAQLGEPEGQGVVLAVGRDLEQALQDPALDQELDGGRLDRPEDLPLPVPDEDLRARHLR